MPDPPRQLPDILNIKTSFYFFTPVSCHFSLSIAYLPSCPRNISGLKNLQGQNQTTFSHYTIIYFFRIANHFFRKKLFRSKKLPYFCIFCIKNHSCPVKNSDKRKKYRLPGEEVANRRAVDVLLQCRAIALHPPAQECWRRSRERAVRGE